MSRDLIASELEQLITRHRTDNAGAVADYIPELSKADPEVIRREPVHDRRCHLRRRRRCPVVHDPVGIQAFVYALALTGVGPERLLEHVGVEPSGDAFNSILLDSSDGPHHPMINSGAITVVSMVAARSAEERFAPFSTSCPGWPVDGWTWMRPCSNPNATPGTATAPSPTSCVPSAPSAAAATRCSMTTSGNARSWRPAATSQ